MLVKAFLLFAMINKLSTDQALIQIKRLENMQHINNAHSLQTVRHFDGRAVTHR